MRLHIIDDELSNADENNTFSVGSRHGHLIAENPHHPKLVPELALWTQFMHQMPIRTYLGTERQGVIVGQQRCSFGAGRAQGLPYIRLARVSLGRTARRPLGYGKGYV